ncbi:MAG TPA: UDP-3-O-(3-hydroxymyristoyl)glucosamine N-acyltransferase [Bryobacteraceae bacterium]|nr:UDP-3-O-(3-hydroxymyristoyl)glucosamine N-acyltransferase [Bryobacteraceae bacterium]
MSTPQSQPRVREVVAYLRGAGAIATGSLPEEASSAELFGVAPDRSAIPGHMSWVSAKAIAGDSDRLAGFRGSLLFVPTEVESGDLPQCAVRADDPKLALVLAVGRFFPQLTETEWPTENTPARNVSVAPSARLAPGVVIGSDTTIGDHCIIGPNTCIANTDLASGVSIGANCTIGLPGFGYRKAADGTYLRFPHIGRVVIGTNVEIGSNTCIDRGALGDTVIHRGAKIDNLVHIAHNVVVGENTLVIAHAMIAGSVEIGRDAWIAPSAAVKNQLAIGEGAVIGLGAVVLKPVAPGETVVGNPAKPLRK